MIFFLLILVSIILFLIFYKKNHFIAEKLNLLDTVSEKKLKIHEIDTPSIGGINIYISTTFFFIFFNNNFNLLNVDILTFWLFITSLFIIGLIDDYIDLSAFKKIILYCVFTFMFFYQDHGLKIEFIFSEVLDAEIALGENAILFSIICAVFLMNALNFLDGIDGIFLTFSLSIVLILIFINFSVFLAFVAFNLFLLLICNINKKLFTGNSGVILIAVIISIYCIDYSQNYPKNLSIEKVLIMFFIPAIDTTRLLVQRILNNKNPFKRDLNHIQHIFFLKVKKSIWIPSLFSFQMLIYFLTFIISPIFILVALFLLYFYILNKYTYEKIK